MKHIYFTFTITVVALFMGITTTKAQMPVVGTEYYIENACSPYMDDGATPNNRARVGSLLSVVGENIEARYFDTGNSLVGKNNQIWTVVVSGTKFKIVNKGKNKALGFNSTFSLVDISEGSEFDITLVQTVTPTGDRFVRMRTDGMAAGSYIAPSFTGTNAASSAIIQLAWSDGSNHGKSNDEISDTHDGVPAAWKFIPVETYEAPYPKMSITDGPSYWYYIERDFNTQESDNLNAGKIVTTGAAATDAISLADKDETGNGSKQLWRFFPNSTSVVNLNFVKIESKLHSENYFSYQTSLKLKTTADANLAVKSMREGKMTIADNFAGGKGMYITDNALSWTFSGVGTPTTICGLYSKSTVTRWKFVQWQSIKALNEYSTTFSHSGGNRTLDVTTATQDVEWEVESPAWVTINELRSTKTGNGTVDYTITSNSGSVRTGNIVVKAIDGSYQQTLAITQDSPTSIGEATLENINVYVENGYIKVTGTKTNPQVYSLTGTTVDAKAKLVAGIYIVKVGAKTVKVVIK